MFKKLKYWINKRAFGSKAIIRVHLILDSLLNSPEAYKKYECVRFIKDKGEEQIQEFRKYINQEVLDIVQSNDPFKTMRIKLISTIKLNLTSRLLFSEEFYKDRQIIYDRLNNYIDDVELNSSDNLEASSALWTDLESICLRRLQGEMFEKISNDDWWSAYVKAYEQFILSLYRNIVAHFRGEQPTIEFPVTKELEKQLHSYEQKLTQ